MLSLHCYLLRLITHRHRDRNNAWRPGRALSMRPSRRLASAVVMNTFRLCCILARCRSKPFLTNQPFCALSCRFFCNENNFIHKFQYDGSCMRQMHLLRILCFEKLVTCFKGALTTKCENAAPCRPNSRTALSVANMMTPSGSKIPSS